LLFGRKWLAVCLLLFAQAKSGAATEGIEFVAEHLPEAVMDNRMATLPTGIGRHPRPVRRRRVALGVTRTTAGSSVSLARSQALH
jgi:hypothetical protein